MLLESEKSMRREYLALGFCIFMSVLNCYAMWQDVGGYGIVWGLMAVGFSGLSYCASKVINEGSFE